MENNLTWQEFERYQCTWAPSWKSKIFRGPKTSLPTHHRFGETMELEKLRQITKRYSKADLLERQIVAVVNFPKNKLVSS
jgi:tRNA-binding protein